MPARTPRRRSPRAILASLASLASLGVGTTACRDTISALGGSPTAARISATELFQAHAARFTEVERTPKFHAARGKLGHYALTPSKLWRDTSVWTGRGSDGSQQLVIDGSFTNGHYVFDARPATPLPHLLGHSRHVIRLRRLGEDDFEWRTDVDMAVGQVRAEEFESGFNALLASAIGRDERTMRSDYRSAFPRTTKALGQLLILDTLRSTTLRDGTSAVTLVASIHPERLRARYPAFAAYVEKYVVPARARLTLRDQVGARFVDATIGGKRVVFRLRTRGGELAPLDGAWRPMPDSLQLRADLSAKMGLFTVGMSDLVADFIVLRSEHERGWFMRFRTEPDWHLPFAAQHFLRSPLRRPFEDGGTTLRVAIRDSAGAQTLITRNTKGVVRESAILRFLNSLSSTAMSDFAGKSEAEENRFIAELFGALRDDVRSLPTAALASEAAAGSR